MMGHHPAGPPRWLWTLAGALLVFGLLLALRSAGYL